MSEKTKGKKNSKSLSLKEEMEQEYEKKDPVEHVLLRPDTYIGSVQTETRKMWIYDEEVKKIIYEEITFVPGFFKIFDEVLVNARDHQIKDKTCKTIKVTIDKETGTISVFNDGNGIPVVMISAKLEKNGPDVELYVPELIFGYLLTGSNYKDDTRNKTTGGKNGYGAKLANIFSKSFIVETVYINKKEKVFKKFIQKHYDNMSRKDDPIITNVSEDTKPYTKITFTPDLARFKMKELTDGVIKLFNKRVYDISACTNEKVSVYLNNKEIKTKNFDDFIKLHYAKDFNPLPKSIPKELSNIDPPMMVYEEINDRWKVGVVFDPDNGDDQISFVNGIWTYNGGTHANHVIDQITKKISEELKKGKTKSLTIKPTQIREHLTFFIDSVIDNPGFSSQTKESLNTKVSDFGSKCEIDSGFMGKLFKTGILQVVSALAQAKAEAGIKKSDGTKTSSVKNIPKLDDAHWAGTKKSKECRLILTEGDSAKAYALSGIEILGRDKFGAFPLKGKMLNVRNATPTQINNNEEFEKIKKILGLKQGVKYTDVSKLRYGGIVILTDQDSVTEDTPLLLKNNNEQYEIRTIDNINISDWKNENGKETSTTDFQVWTDKGWTKIVRVIRHKVNKKIYRVLTHTGVVDVTEDHSLLSKDGTEIEPKKCKINDELLHSYPNFEDNLIIVPENFEDLSCKEIYEVAKKFKIQYYQNYSKNELINRINELRTIPLLKLNTINTISKEEAYVMGLFFADGTCQIYKWDYKKKPINRPNEYTFHRTSYSWAISNTNIDYLNKSINILKKIYDYDFKIIEDRHGANINGHKLMYKLIINGGKKTSPIIKKYRNFFYDKHSLKKIPPEILNSSLEVRENFFEGYYDGDGCKVSKSGSKSFDINGKIGANGLFFLCKSIGYEVSINTHEDKKNNNIYTLTLTKGTQQHHPNTIKKILELGNDERYVYDLETENHHFQAGIGRMIVHNTDGSHIKGLLVNMFQHFWPELLLIDGFIQTLATPLIKVWKISDKKKTNPKVFYSVSEYEKWADEIIKKGEIKKWGVPKYYKGLGTSDANEAKELFKEYDERIVSFIWEKHNQNGERIKETNSEKDNNDNSDSDSDSDTETKAKKSAIKLIKIQRDRIITDSVSTHSIVKAFAKDESDQRKEWLSLYDKNNVLEYNKPKITYTEFIDKDLKHFSIEDTIRSIPSLVDGLKPSQRKVLYAGFKRNLKSEVKVAQFASYVAEHTAYKHGEKSLEDTIVGMAQRFPGSNNIYLFHPCGNFGFRRQGGDERASSRYIFTYLDPISRKIFINKDEQILNYLEDEGEMIEPDVYLPIIPMVLANGAKGIGTGWSTDIPMYNPMDVIDNSLRKLDGKNFKPMHPWYYGFKGSIEKSTEKNKESGYKITGVFDVIDYNTIKISEIPIKGPYWKSLDYEEFIKTLEDTGKEEKKTKEKSGINKRTPDKILEHIKPDCGNDTINFKVTFKGQELQNLIKNSDDEKGGVEKALKLVANISTTNMWLFDSNGQIKKYESPLEIMEEFFEFRLKKYAERKQYHLKFLNNELEILKYQVKFIQDVLDNKIIIYKKKRADIIATLKKLNYPKLSIRLDALDPPNDDIDDSDDKVEKNTDENTDEIKKKKRVYFKSYDYVTGMKLFSLTHEKIEELNKKLKDKKDERDDYNSTSESELWRRELLELKEYYPNWLEEREEEQNKYDIAKIGKNGKMQKVSVKKSAKKPVISKINKSDSESDSEPDNEKPNKKTKVVESDSEDEKPKKSIGKKTK